MNKTKEIKLIETLNNNQNLKYLNNRNSEISIKNSMEKVKKFYIDTSGGPGLLQYFYFPAHLRQGLHILSEAKKSKNGEAIRDANLNIFNLTAGAIYSFSALSSILAQIQVLFSCITLAAVRISPGIGIAASCVASAIEMRSIRKQRDFRINCNKAIAELKEGKLDKNSLQFILKYIDTPEADPVRLCRLAIRVKPWFAEKLALELPKALEDSKIEQEKIQKTLDLLIAAKTQSEKKIVEQVLVLVANSVLIAAFASVLASQPYLILVTLFALNVSVVAFNYFFSAGTQNHTGWSFSAKDCVPFKSLRAGFSKLS